MGWWREGLICFFFFLFFFLFSFCFLGFLHDICHDGCLKGTAELRVFFFFFDC
jgi:hypothetical protein